jgi:hypothetical protein
MEKVLEQYPDEFEEKEEEEETITMDKQRHYKQKIFMKR